ncbi:MAG TPA: HEAT repeat domain-containing protein [Methanomicrobia archaeon]|nr:HEAT repeat domain-containing protein [Methanomicrobia archaeon]
MAQNEENNRLDDDSTTRKGTKTREQRVGELMRALTDEDWDVRRRAAYALGNLGEAAVRPLIRALTNDRWDVRRKAAWALGNIGDPRAVAPLLHALKDDCGDVREQVAWALGALRDLTALEPLIHALSDPDSSVRHQAARSLAVFAVLNEHRVTAALEDYESRLTDDGREHFRQYRELYEQARQKARLSERQG